MTPPAALPPILFVDDELVDHFLLQARLKKAGVNNLLITFPNCEELRGFLERGDHRKENTSDQPCLLLVDARMPGMDGFELIAWVNGRIPRAQLRIVMMSFSEDPTHRARAKALGVDEYVLKFPSPQVLSELVAGRAAAR